MLTRRFSLAIPLLLAVSATTASASAIRDGAGMFKDRDAVRKAQAILDRAERTYGVPTVIETIPSLRGRSPDAVAVDLARRSGSRGVFVMVAKAEGKLEVRDFHELLGHQRRQMIQNAFVDAFKSRDFDGGLVRGAEAIESAIASAPRAASAGRAGVARRGAGSSGLGLLLMIGLVILAVFIGIRVLGALFGAGRGGYGPGGYGGGRPGYGPGYAGGGGGGGFWSSVMGGLGGAIAGNWIYDQMSGRHHTGGGYSDPGTGGSEPAEWGGGGEVGDWGGGGDVAGGGGDWGGGGGGDWGGGGGDWGGGGGGGDWS